MRTPVFLVYCLIIFTGIVCTQALFRHHFSGVNQLSAKIEQLESKVEQEQLRAAVAAYQLEDFRQMAATLIPEALKDQRDGQKTHQLRNLASIAQAARPGAIKLERASGLFEEARKTFRDQLYEDSNEKFRNLIRLYPNSTHVIEAHFLLVEGLFQLRDFENCIDVIEALIALYPESQLTGYAMLRLGKIYENQDRLEDAVEVYKTVVASFSDVPLIKQAKISLGAIEL